MTEKLVRENERVDDLQNGYYVIQDPEKFCFGMDAVLLSGFTKVKKGENALDMGTGTGIIPILPVRQMVSNFGVIASWQVLKEKYWYKPAIWMKKIW